MPTNEEHAIRLIAGLGNPGPEYEGTRHNLGFAVVERLLSRLPKGMERVHRYNSFYWHGSCAGRSLFLQMPQTFMNCSGEAIAPLAAANGIDPSEILIVYDDMDLPVGKFRIRPSGGPGGHNGMKSIIENLKTENFPRMRIGIGRGARGHGMADYVLAALDPAEKEILEKVTDAAADALMLALRRGLAMASSLFNSKDFAPAEISPDADDNQQKIQNITTKQHLEVQA